MNNVTTNDGLWARLLQAGRERAFGAPKGERQMHVLETLSLGGRRQLVRVGCGAQQFLVGMGADAVTHIIALRDSADEVPL